FETFFGGGRTRGAADGARRAPRPGGDWEAPVEVTLDEAYRGTTRQFAIPTPDGQTRRIEVTIPPGVTDGSRVRLSGQGQPGQAGGPAGNLYLVVSVRPDPRFERRGEDLHHRLQAPWTVLVLGGEVRTPTPDGRSLVLTIPPGTQDGRVFSLRGQGMPRLGSPGRRGDLFVEVHARLPDRLTPRQRELIDELARIEADATEGAGRR
ncbi:MAG: J domain-containing protein, partial [Chloroflexi bacterium]|nr:J domain-containing protein [Chloroflexota bacterium]